MKYFVETLLLKFKEKKIEFELMKDECKGLKEKIKGLEKRNKIKRTGGKEMIARFGFLEDEYRKMEIEERGKCVQLSMEIEGLKCAKKRADEEVEELKMQATAMVAMVNANVELGKELEDYKAKYHGLVVQLNEKESWKKRLMELVRLRRKMDGKVDVVNMVHPELTDNLHYNNNHQEHSENDLVEKKETCSDSMVESVIAVEHQIALEAEGNLGDSLVLLKQGDVNTLPMDVIEIDSEDEVVEVTDSEDEKEITATHPCSVEVKELPLVSTDETMAASQKCLKRKLSLQRDEEREASSDKVVLNPCFRMQ
ncbi:hypothetical protein MKW92_009293 [Papaver armeniacum]|nr:hypothetical protein MKW92_009293 [Papaver armeniacum]